MIDSVPAATVVSPLNPKSKLHKPNEALLSAAITESAPPKIIRMKQIKTSPQLPALMAFFLVIVTTASQRKMGIIWVFECFY